MFNFKVAVSEDQTVELKPNHEEYWRIMDLEHIQTKSTECYL
jgi:hypothetical protein